MARYPEQTYLQNSFSESQVPSLRHELAVVCTGGVDLDREGCRVIVAGCPHPVSLLASAGCCSFSWALDVVLDSPI